MAPRRRTTNARRRRDQVAPVTLCTESGPEDGLENSTLREKARLAEMARERKLRNDKLCILKNARVAQCLRCWKVIKLSDKSRFDPFHWTRHRERCLKRPDSAIRKERLKNPKPEDFEAESDIEDVDSEDDEDENPSRPERVEEDLPRPTPPLTEDLEEDRSSTTASSASLASPVSTTTTLSPFHSPRIARSCEISAQAYERVLHYAQREASYSGDLDYWRRTTYYKESQLRSTQYP